MVGEAVDLTYPYDHLGTGRAALDELVGDASATTTVKEAPTLVIVGQGALTGADGAAVLAAAMAFCEATRLEAPGPAHGGEPGRGDGPRLHDRGRDRGGARAPR